MKRTKIGIQACTNVHVPTRIKLWTVLCCHVDVKRAPGACVTGKTQAVRAANTHAPLLWRTTQSLAGSLTHINALTLFPRWGSLIFGGGTAIMAAIQTKGLHIECTARHHRVSTHRITSDKNIGIQHCA